MRYLPIHPNFSLTRLEAHWAAQIPAAASRLIAPRADYSHTILAIDGDWLVGQALKDGRRVAVHLSSLRLRLGDAYFELEGRTLGDGLAWLTSELGGSFERLPHDLPERVDGAFVVRGAGEQLRDWIALGDSLLKDIQGSVNGGAVYIWPHHFDMATLAVLDGADVDPEEARSINVGLSLGDGAYDEPYWYVTPWPVPRTSLPELTTGAWHTNGFTAAVLPASKIEGDVSMKSRAFLNEATAACQTLLQR